MSVWNTEAENEVVEPGFLEYNDEECGKIFFNKDTLLLKYFCLACRVVYDDINLFCEHLSMHIDLQQQRFTSINNEEINFTNVDQNTLIQNAEFEALEELNNQNTSEGNENPIDGHNKEELKIITWPDADGLEDNILIDIKTDVESKLIEQDPLVIKKTKSQQTNISQCQADEAKGTVEKLNSVVRNSVFQPTIVKVIQVRNRIEELYNRIIVDKKQHTANDETTMNSDEMVMSKNKILEYSENSAYPIKNITDGKTCPACHRTFRNPISLASHMRIHYLETNNKIKLAYKCMDCGKLCNNGNDVYDHMAKTHFPEGFNCKICSAKCRSMPLLKQHIKSAHVLNKLACKECARTFQRNDLLTKHKIRWHPPPAKEGDNPQFQCKQCSRKYLTKLDLSQHMQHHSRISEICDICGKATFQLKLHKETAHKPKPQRTFTCNLCSMHFSFNSALSRHLKVIHQTSVKSISISNPDNEQLLLDSTDIDSTAANIFDHNYIFTPKLDNIGSNHSNHVFEMEPPPMIREETISLTTD